MKVVEKKQNCFNKFKNKGQFPEQEQTSWQCVWSAQTAIPVVHLAFSPDGTLFATCGENDRLVKIWFENRHGKCLLK